jgi:hypothetical protein
VSKTQTSVRAQVIRGLAKEHGLPRKVIAGSNALSARVGGFRVSGLFGTKSDPGRVRRGKVKTQGIDAEARLWIGTLPIPVEALGTPVQTRSGVTVGGKSFPGAFLATMPNMSRPRVFERKGRSRLPIRRVTFPLTASDKVLREAERFAGERLQTVFVRELNYEVNIRGA